MKNECARVLTSLCQFCRRSRTADSAVSGGIPSKLYLIQAFMVVLVTCKNKEDQIKHECLRVLTRFSPYYVYGIFSNAQGQLTPQSLVESSRNSNSSKLLWLFLLTYKNEEDPIKNECTILLTRLSVVFQTLKGS